MSFTVLLQLFLSKFILLVNPKCEFTRKYSCQEMMAMKKNEREKKTKGTSNIKEKKIKKGPS